MSASLTDLAYQACRDIGCLRPGTSAVQSPDVLADIKTKANQIIDAFKIQPLMAYAYPAQIFTLTAALEQYRIGPGQSAPNFNAARPTGIADANVIITSTGPSTVRRPLAIWTKDEWARITVRATPPGTTAPISAIPEGIYYDSDFDEATGYATINLWPAPSTPQQLELFTSQTMPFSSFADLTTVYTFPPGYEDAFRKILADEITPMMMFNWKVYRLAGMQQPASAMLDRVHQMAVEAKAMLMSDNIEDGIKFVDKAFRGAGNKSSFNYATGSNGGDV